MSLTNASAANCLKFNSSFLRYIGFFVLLLVGYLWGRRTGTKEGEKKARSKSDSPSKSSGKTRKTRKSRK